MPGWNYNDWGMHGGTGWFGAVFMFITMMVFWGGLITVAALLLRRFNPHGTHTRTPRPASSTSASPAVKSTRTSTAAASTHCAR